MSKLKKLAKNWGLPVERDLYFTPTKLSEL